MKLSKKQNQMILTGLSIIAGVIVIGVIGTSLYEDYQDNERRKQMYKDVSKQILSEPEQKMVEYPNYPELGEKMINIIELVQIQNLNDGITTTEFDRCNFTITYEKQFEHRYIFHDWKMEFYTWSQCNPDVRTMMLMVYSNLVEERLKVLDPPVTRELTSVSWIDWNGQTRTFYAEFDSDGHKMIEFKTKASGFQKIFLNEDMEIPTREELCVDHQIDITLDGSCLYQIVKILEERIDNMEDVISEGHPRGTFPGIELIPEPGDRYSVRSELIDLMQSTLIKLSNHQDESDFMFDGCMFTFVMVNGNAELILPSQSDTCSRNTIVFVHDTWKEINRIQWDVQS